MDFQRQPVADARQAGMVGRLLDQRDAQECPQGKTVAATPSDAALRADTLEVTHQQHAKVNARRNRRPTQVAMVVRPALPLDPSIKPRLGEKLVQLSIEHMPFRLRQAGGGHPHLLLLASSLSQRHRPCLLRFTMAIPYSCSEEFSTGC